MPLTNSYYFLGGNKTETITNHHYSTSDSIFRSNTFITVTITHSSQRGINAV